jgi:hypothetical protein
MHGRRMNEINRKMTKKGTREQKEEKKELKE